MREVIIPDIEAVGDVLAAEDIGEAVIVAEADVVIGGSEDDVPIAVVVVVEPSVVEMGEIVDGVVEVGEFIEVAVEEGPVVEGAGQGDAAGDGVGVAEGEVDGVIAAEGAAVDSEVDAAGAMADKGEDLMEDVLFVGVVTADAIGGVGGFVVPGFSIDAVDAEEHEVAVVEAVPEGFDHAVVFVFVERAHRGGEDEDGVTGMAELEKLHVLVQTGACPAVVLAVHERIRIASGVCYSNEA